MEYYHLTRTTVRNVDIGVNRFDRRVISVRTCNIFLVDHILGDSIRYCKHYITIIHETFYNIGLILSFSE